MKSNLKWFLLFAVIAAASVLMPARTVQAETIQYYQKEVELYTSGDFQYVLTDEGAAIVRYTSTASAVSIPTTLDGHTVVAIERSKGYWDDGEGAFQNNSSMQTVTIPNTVKWIGINAFKNCSGLQQVLIADGVTEIMEGAFSDCNYLQQVQFRGAALVTIGESAFQNCYALDDLTLPESVETICQFAFENCIALSKIEIPDSVTTIGGGAFSFCTSLASAVIGNGAKALDSAYNYWGYDDAGYSKQYLGVFEGCSSLTSVTIGSSVTELGDDSFAGTALKNITIPSNVETIGNGVLYNCDKLAWAVIGDGVKTVGAYALYDCNALEKLTIGSNVRTIGDYFCTYDNTLKTITIPSSVETIGGAAFGFCTSLTDAVIGNGLVELTSYYNYWGLTNSGDYDAYLGMFEGCSVLSSVSIGNGVVTIGCDAFAGTMLTSVTIPDNVITISDGAFSNNANLKSISIGNGVTSIGEKIFSDCTGLTSVSLGKGLITIGNRAFENCASLPYLLIPSNVTTLGAAICVNCTSLEKVIVGNGVTELVSEYSYWGTGSSGKNKQYLGTFDGCTSLREVTLGSGLLKIGNNTFAGTCVETILIPAKVNSVGEGAFYNSGIASIYFTGAAPELGSELFGSHATPAMYYIAGAVGYDETAYAFSTFTPITVRFNLNENDIFAIAPINQLLSPEGGYVIEPIDSAAEDYIFKGWFHDSATAESWDFLNDKVTEDTTIYAKWSRSGSVVPDKPGKPVTETVTGSNATISWEASEGAESYNIYVDNVYVASVSATSYSVTGLESDSVYEVYVTAVNSQGESAASLITVIWTTDASVLTGDVNQDGEVAAADALLTLQYVVKLKTLDATQLEAADVNHDNEVTSVDALRILQYVVKLIPSF